MNIPEKARPYLYIAAGVLGVAFVVALFSGASQWIAGLFGIGAGAPILLEEIRKSNEARKAAGLASKKEETKHAARLAEIDKSTAADEPPPGASLEERKRRFLEGVDDV